MAEETATPKTPKEEVPKKAKVEKVKEPTLEELPFEEFITKHYLPSLSKALSGKGINDLNLQFEPSEQSQIKATWQNNLRQFVIYFSKPDINGQKAFACADGGTKPQVIEPFLLDERKATLDLMVFGVMQRLNAQKWLAAN